MKGPRLERTASLITVPPASGKFFYVLGEWPGAQWGVQCPPDNSLIHNNGSPKTGVYQHVKRHRGIEPRPNKTTTHNELTNNKNNQTKTVRQLDY